ncbi:MAG: endonuclease/exonuclease/phosphatase family protein [Phycisphaerae bacterium]|nr:endonuclease/exonuclease/phosphatase family protein [Phycisphaerae bacterium]
MSCRAVWPLGTVLALAAVSLGVACQRSSDRAPARELPPRPLRVLTWNVQKGEHGLDALIAELRQADADIICLQEVTEPRGKAAVPNQSEQLGKALGMYVYSHGDRLDDERNQALAILSRVPLLETKALCAPDTTRNYAVTAVAPWRDLRLRIACVHLAGTWKAQWEHVQETSAARLRDWTALRAAANQWTGPTIIAGDFNTLPGASQFAELGDRLRIVSGTEPTFPSATPAMCLDYVLSSTELSCTKVTRVATAASDHQPVLVEFDLTDAATTKPTTQPRQAEREP